MGTLASDPQTALVAEKLTHTLDLFKSELAKVTTEQAHSDELVSLRLAKLETQAADFESRLRQLQDSSTQFKVLASLATGGGILSVISLVRELIR